MRIVETASRQAGNQSALATWTVVFDIADIQDSDRSLLVARSLSTLHDEILFARAQTASSRVLERLDIIIRTLLDYLTDPSPPPEPGKTGDRSEVQQFRGWFRRFWNVAIQLGRVGTTLKGGWNLWEVVDEVLPEMMDKLLPPGGP